MISTQLNYALVPRLCAASMGWLVPCIALLLIALSLLGGFFSWRVWTHVEPTPVPDSTLARPRRLLAGVSILAAVLFALVIASQGSAGLILQGCER
jgi:hypothetical protein